ncbi:MULTISPECIES: CHC2 zinc finger domain-containing protein [Niastella]|uniref:Toprim domain-containing protein n=1 Tax=Niastella soli TaxID=2821487 RepID=A0ABS3YZ83_9BACT|nr:CHC2 zinc finger domain-containing protein [Niastella soli]MBO9203237.1 toprim domain-containing protein [Niastella soli]
MKQLSCEQAKQIDMVDYLSSLNHLPNKVHNQDHWYLSPFRQEHTASFKVNRKLNVWYDFGIGKGGDIINFGTIYHNCTITEVLSKLSAFQNHSTLSLHPPTISGETASSSSQLAGERKESTDSKILAVAVRPLSANALFEYIEKRKIPLDVADQYCREVDFVLYGKQQTVIGFPNNAGGYELRSENFKGSSSPKDITFIDNKTDQLVVFEGFFSFLSFCIINKNQTTPLTNCLVLNSLAFLDKSRDLMEKHVRVHLLLDRDLAGKKHTEKALNWNRDRYIDKSEFYGGHKDLNDWLIHNRNSLQQGQRQGKRL